MGFTARLRWLALASWRLGQACQRETRRQVVEVQELRYRQQEQFSMYDLWAEKIVCRGCEASHGQVCEEGSRRHAREPCSSTPGGSGIQTRSGSCRKGLSPDSGDARIRRRLQGLQSEVGQTGAGIEGNVRGRRRLCERENCDSREDRRSKGRQWPRTNLLVRVSTRPEYASHVRNSVQRKRRKLRRWFSQSSRSQTWRSRASNANCTTHAPAVPAEIGVDNTVDAISGQLQRLLDILEEDPGMDPNRLSPATAHSAQHIEGVQHAFEEVERQRGLQADLPKEDARETSLRIRSGDERRDLGRMKEKSCSTFLNTMTMATANVHPKEESESRSRFGGTLMIGTVKLLEIAARDAAVDVVGLQETRSRHTGIFYGPLYRRYCGAADSNGNADCQLWVAASWNFTMLTMDDISPRLLVVIGRRANSGTLLNFLPVNTRHTKKS